MEQCFKKHIITIVAASLLVIAVVVTVVVVVVTKNSKKKEEDDKGKGGGDPQPEPQPEPVPGILTVIKNNSELEKPNIKLNAEMELVKMGNNMTGLIISDPFSSKFHIQFTMKYGDYIDTIPGISNLGKHMILQSSEKYNYLYPFYNSFSPIKDSIVDSETGGTYQSYYISF